jgi:Protein of unknown function (DUF3095)
VKDDLGLVMKAALVPVAYVRAKGVDVRVARFAPSPNVTYAMFSGGGLEWADDRLAHCITDAAVFAGLSRNASQLAVRYEPIVALRLDPLNHRLHSRKQVREGNRRASRLDRHDA